ncbi:MAG TPA: sugar phosphate isomerase/epimerase family protein [Limnochordia bacterium]|nr:sugar phosphate isomerase/epimerase family protein [Limnochordia bacterium]
MRFVMLCDASQPQRVAPICHRTGLGVEIQSFSNPEYPSFDPNGVALHHAHYDSVEPKALHGPFGDLSFGSCDALIRNVTRDRFEFAYSHALKLGVKHVVLHHGYIPNTNTYGGWLRRSVDFWNDFLSAKSTDVTFYLENLLEVDAELIRDVLRTVDHPNLKACLDLGHAFCHGKIPIKKWIGDLGERIGYVHFHDNLGDQDSHLSLGEGRLPLDEICYTLEQVSPDAIWALEVGPENLEDSLFWLESHGYLPSGG